MSDKDKSVGGLVFVACMFIGLGIGLLFDKPNVGMFLGMGIGFLFMAFLKGKEIRTIEISIPKTLPSLILTIVGLFFVIAGVLLFKAPELIYPYLIGFAAIIIGLLIFVVGFTSIIKKLR